ncbi:MULTISPECIES: preprotein translocase subunit SecG [Paraburkholderia]|uniref:Protein-export membrane protein SecG n=1 Tax=Paraburkholderia silvatlantica TaxID=321895 RepID=A0A2U1A5V5_9BURK|nr:MULTISPECIES: preprotein translocase subunit SecG [Paraburkholderia]MBB2930885.1 preprotein translocase subunit SecG [Paraburkholderia silvatlantica]PVY27078.1 protein translocase subunit secG [Paraburkholderia silvatlantica]PXW33354.1 protein translocase subunit secG [Paraburkholderia silvatlantica]PYE18972.1 protein translocase subunit secG [Paraburkholderia silvatlantica]TDQ83741.1 protein translocase subunit secG [Paraburkholderia silvatlantica]
MLYLKTLIIVVQLLSALGVIGLVLLQHGKGADMGAAFGSGASGSLFGASGSANFLSRTTAVLATVFFCSTLALTYLGSYHAKPSAGVLGASVPAPAQVNSASAPAASAPVASAPGATAAAAASPAAAASQPGNDVPK